jgi:hypothetical protein
MAAYVPSCSNWRSPAQEYPSSSEEEEEEEFGEYDYYDEGEYGEEEEYYDEEEYDEEEEEYDEEEEEYVEECEEEEEYVEEEEEYDEEEYYEEECEEEEEEYDEDEYSYEEEDIQNCPKPSTWRDMPYDKEVELVQLPKKSPEYLKVKSKVQLTLQVHIDKVVRIQNPYLWDCYTLMKGEYEAYLGSTYQEMELFHATAQSNIQSIAKNNLDWRRTKRSKFGNGVSFSPRAHYANKYCNFDAGTKRALILARVLVGKCHEGGYGLKAPAKGYDTTTGNSKSVYVKYQDNEFYPEYVVYYRH